MSDCGIGQEKTEMVPVDKFYESICEIIYVTSY